MDLFNSICNSYKKISIVGKVLIWVMLFLIVVTIFKVEKQTKEGFIQTNDFLFIEGDKVYDNFYANIYDNLVYNDVKNEFEIGELVNKTTPTRESLILDIGCGTGRHVDLLAKKGFNVIGIDKSQDMVNKAKENYPEYNFMRGDVLNALTFQPNSFTHILCLYFTIYYFKNKQHFFQNCYNWLLPDGYLVVHIVDRNNFDPILPPANPLYLISPQRYAKERITTSKVIFEGFNYSADFKLDDKENKAKFIEKFTDKKSKKVRRQEHIMYMEDENYIIQMAQNVGFVVQSKIDLLQIQYEYQYLYIFKKVN